MEGSPPGRASAPLPHLLHPRCAGGPMNQAGSRSDTEPVHMTDGRSRGPCRHTTRRSLSAPPAHPLALPSPSPPPPHLPRPLSSSVLGSPSSFCARRQGPGGRMGWEEKGHRAPGAGKGPGFPPVWAVAWRLETWCLPCRTVPGPFSSTPGTQAAGRAAAADA